MMIYLNATQYAAKHGVSKQRVIEWINAGRLSAWKPVERVFMIDANAARPEQLKPGRPTRNKSIVSDK